jgi:uracil-DNA glycosylase
MSSGLNINGWNAAMPPIYDVWHGGVCPDRSDIFKALLLTAPEDVKVIILGQDPYPTMNDGICKAHGLSFGINPNWTRLMGPHAHMTSSFRTIAGEVERAGYEIHDPSLEDWARQGVLLLNTRLTVAAGSPMSHANLGWEHIVDRLLKQATTGREDIIWASFGREARLVAHKYPGIHLDVSHPCRYSATRGSKQAPAFVGSNIFGVINDTLRELGKEGIDWGRNRKPQRS